MMTYLRPRRNILCSVPSSKRRVIGGTVTTYANSVNIVPHLPFRRNAKLVHCDEISSSKKF
jgi:hypothetical protein